VFVNRLKNLTKLSNCATRLQKLIFFIFAKMLRHNISQNLTTFIATYYEKSFLINDTMLLFVNLKKKIVALLAMQIEK